MAPIRGLGADLGAQCAGHTRLALHQRPCRRIAGDRRCPGDMARGLRGHNGVPSIRRCRPPEPGRRRSVIQASLFSVFIKLLPVYFYSYIL